MENYKNWTNEEFVNKVENADMWDDFEPEVYEYFLDQVGLDYKNFDDPDAMWEAYLNKLN